MKIERKQIQALSKDQYFKLENHRKNRNFDVKKYVQFKTKLIDSYLRKYNITACVVGISGGLDSAVVLALLKKTAELGQLKHIYPLVLPALSSKGVTGQKEATEYAKLVCNHYELEYTLIDMSETIAKIENEFGQPISNWSNGQLVSTLRVPFFNFVATLSNQQGNRGIVVGTTNRSEAFLGYMGKYSDLMVDIQPITDLFKSEEYELAKYLDVPQQIINRVPTGDVYDGSTDEDIFGATYDAVELHAYERLDGKAGEHLEDVRNYNSHKFNTHTTAIHLDIQESGLEGAWDVQFETKYWKNLHLQGDIIKPSFVAPTKFYNIELNSKHTPVFEDFQDYATCDLLTKSEIEQLLQIFNDSDKKHANVYGYTKGPETKEIGSKRCTLYNVELADKIWNRIKSNIDNLVLADKPTTDWKSGEMYRAVGVNPAFRFIGYMQDDSSLVPHYDYSFVNGDYKTLKSLVIYLTTNKTGGTRFLQDYQAGSWNKDLSDWKAENKATAISKGVVMPVAGQAIMFDHHLLHDSDYVNGEYKVIIRTDIVYEKIKHSNA